MTCACGTASYTLPCGSEKRAGPPVCHSTCCVPRVCRHAAQLPPHRQAHVPEAPHILTWEYTCNSSSDKVLTMLDTYDCQICRHSFMCSIRTDTAQASPDWLSLPVQMSFWTLPTLSGSLQSDAVMRAPMQQQDLPRSPAFTRGSVQQAQAASC